MTISLTPTARLLDEIERTYSAQLQSLLAESEKAAKLAAPFFQHDGSREFVTQVGQQFRETIDAQRQKAIATARAARDESLTSLRTIVTEAIRQIRAEHAPLRHSLRLSLAPAPPSGVEDAYVDALRRAGTVADIARLWSDAVSARDHATARWLERHAHEHVQHPELAQAWQLQAAERAEGRLSQVGGSAYSRIKADEAAIDSTVRMIQEHPLSSEVSASMGKMGFSGTPDDKLLTGNIAFSRWHAPKPEPILD